MNPTKDYRREAMESLLSAKAWFDCMYDQAEQDARNSTHYGTFFVESCYTYIRDRINTAIDEIRNMKMPELAVILRSVDSGMSMLEDDLNKGEEIAKPYYMFLADIRLNIKQAQWSMILANKQEEKTA